MPTETGVWMAEHGLDLADLETWDVTRDDEGRLCIPILAPNGEQAFMLYRQFGKRKYDFAPKGSRHGFVLYGLDRARPAVCETGFIVVTEGFSDAIALHKAGVGNAVSCLTSTLTRTQWALLRAETDSAIVWFDGDDTGQTHARHIAEKLDEVPHPLRTVLATIDGYDPASLWANRGKPYISAVLAVMQAGLHAYRYLHLNQSLRIQPDSIKYRLFS